MRLPGQSPILTSPPPAGNLTSRCDRALLRSQNPPGPPAGNRALDCENGLPYDTFPKYVPAGSAKSASDGNSICLSPCLCLYLDRVHRRPPFSSGVAPPSPLVTTRLYKRNTQPLPVIAPVHAPSAVQFPAYLDVRFAPAVSCPNSPRHRLTCQQVLSSLLLSPAS